MKKVFSLMLLLATILTFTACGDDDDEEPIKSPKLSAPYKYTLYSGENTIVRGESLTNLKWTGDNFVAEIDKNGILHANKIGYTSIHSNEIKAGDFIGIHVTVLPKIVKYSEPLLYRQGVGSLFIYQNGYIQFNPNTYSNIPRSDIWDTTSDFIPHYIKECGLPWTIYKQDGNSIIFKTDKTASPYVAYIFDNNRKVIGAGVYIKPNQINSLPDFLDERYLIYDVNVSNYTANFAHAGGHTEEPEVDYIGQMGYSSSLDMVILSYVPVSNNRGDISNILHNLSNLVL